MYCLTRKHFANFSPCVLAAAMLLAVRPARAHDAPEPHTPENLRRFSAQAAAGMADVADKAKVLIQNAEALLRRVIPEEQGKAGQAPALPAGRPPELPSGQDKEILEHARRVGSSAGRLGALRAAVEKAPLPEGSRAFEREVAAHARVLQGDDPALPEWARKFAAVSQAAAGQAGPEVAWELAGKAVKPNEVFGSAGAYSAEVPDKAVVFSLQGPPIVTRARGGYQAPYAPQAPPAPSPAPAAPRPAATRPPSPSAPAPAPAATPPAAPSAPPGTAPAPGPGQTKDPGAAKTP